MESKDGLIMAYFVVFMVKKLDFVTQFPGQAFYLLLAKKSFFWKWSRLPEVRNLNQDKFAAVLSEKLGQRLFVCPHPPHNSAYDDQNDCKT